MKSNEDQCIWTHLRTHDSVLVYEISDQSLLDASGKSITAIRWQAKRLPRALHAIASFASSVTICRSACEIVELERFETRVASC